MVNIYVYGLDQFVVGDISVGLTESLAKLYELSEDDINFVAPNNMVFHKGVEQTSWRVFVEVKAPEEVKKMQANAKEIIFHYLSEIAIHVEVVFSYYPRSNRYLHVNDKYPLYLNESEGVILDEEYDGEYVEGEGEDEIYTGDIFEGVKFPKDDDEGKHH